MLVKDMLSCWPMIILRRNSLKCCTSSLWSLAPTPPVREQDLDPERRCGAKVDLDGVDNPQIVSEDDRGNFDSSWRLEPTAVFSRDGVPALIWRVGQLCI